MKRTSNGYWEISCIICVLVKKKPALSRQNSAQKAFTCHCRLYHDQGKSCILILFDHNTADSTWSQCFGCAIYFERLAVAPAPTFGKWDQLKG